MKTLLLVLFLTLSAVAQTDSQLLLDSTKVHDIHSRVTEIGEPRMPSTQLRDQPGKNWPLVLKYSKKALQLQQLQEEEQAFIDSVYENYAPEVPRWKAGSHLNDVFEKGGSKFFTGTELSLISEFFVMAKPAQETINKIALEYMEQRGLNFQFLSRMNNPTLQLVSIDECSRMLLLLSYLGGLKEDQAAQVDRLQALVQDLMLKNPKAEQEFFGKRKWPQGSRNTEVSEAAAEFLKKSECWKNNPKFQLLKADTIGGWFLVQKGSEDFQRYAHRVIVVQVSAMSTERSAEVVELVFVTRDNKKVPDFESFWMDSCYRIMRDKV